MSDESPSVRAVRFGIFEMDLRNRELRQDGLSLKVEAKPFQALELLVERAGDLVTRKELRERLWPDSFVEFDRNLNTTINKLRKTLGDRVESPRYIETRSRLGYRFVAPVDSVRPAAWPRPWSPWRMGVEAQPPGQPSLVPFAEKSAPPALRVTAASPSVEGDAVRFELQRPSGELVELRLRLISTEEGAVDMRLDSSGAEFERSEISSRGRAGFSYTLQAARAGDR